MNFGRNWCVPPAINDEDDWKIGCASASPTTGILQNLLFSRVKLLKQFQILVSGSGRQVAFLFRETVYIVTLEVGGLNIRWWLPIRCIFESNCLIDYLILVYLMLSGTLRHWKSAYLINCHLTWPGISCFIKYGA